MSDNNAIIAKQIVKQLKARKLIADDKMHPENKIASGTIEGSEWKLLFEQKIRNTEKNSHILIK